MANKVPPINSEIDTAPYLRAPHRHPAYLAAIRSNNLAVALGHPIQGHPKYMGEFTNLKTKQLEAWGVKIAVPDIGKRMTLVIKDGISLPVTYIGSKTITESETTNQPPLGSYVAIFQKDDGTNILLINTDFKKEWIVYEPLEGGRKKRNKRKTRRHYKRT